MKSIEDFEAFLVPYAQFTPSDILQHVLRESIIAFMRESRIAYATLDIETQDKVADYLLDLPDCHRFLGVRKVMRGTFKCNGQVYNWEELLQGDGGHFYVHLRKGSNPFIQLADPDYKSHKLRVEYYWAINRDECEVPDYIYEDFMDTIVAGALIRLAQVPEHDHLLRTIQVNQKTWFDGVQKAKVEKTGGRPKQIIGRPFMGRRGGRVWR